MLKKIITFGMLIFVIAGLGMGIYFATFSNENAGQESVDSHAIFEKMQTRPVEVTEFFTYGKAFNFSGSLPEVLEDNFESAKLYITDGKEFEKTYPLEGVFADGKLAVTTTAAINKGLILDELAAGSYIVLVRLKLNNSVNPKYYSLKNQSDYQDIQYYTVTKENENKKVTIHFDEETYNKQAVSYLSLQVEAAEEPSEVYDIVLDAGHGGEDVGERAGSDTEAGIALNYVSLLKEKLEAQGLKVKLTRDGNNSETFTATNMYDENGRITVACQSKAKLMLSLHLNSGNKGLRGLEVYAPGRSNLDFAQYLANKIVTYTGLEYSNNNSFKAAEGVYVRNFTASVINDYTASANRKGYAPYNITLDTPYLFTIREVGGIATNAFVDGRNTAYSANRYWNSNQGIECYQIEMGYIKNDLEIIKTQIEQYTAAIAEAVVENY